MVLFKGVMGVGAGFCRQKVISDYFNNLAIVNCLTSIYLGEI